MTIHADVASFCCWRMNEETGEMECCQYIKVRLIGAATALFDSMLAEEVEPGCCTVTGLRPGQEPWPVGFHYAGCAEISAGARPATEAVCGAFSAAVGLSKIECEPDDPCGGISVTIEGAEE